MEFFLRDDFIKLGQLMKAAGWVQTGSEAKEVIAAGEVKINGEVCVQRGKKCEDGDRISWNGQEITVRAGTADR